MVKLKVPFLVFSLVLTVLSSGYAVDKAPTQDQREEMAVAHEKMATCLRSSTPIDDCHKELMKSCMDKDEKGLCPMMGESKRHHRMGK